MSATTAPFKAEIVGSFLRPQVIHDARAQRGQGKITPEQLFEIEAREVDGVVAMQKAAGLKVCTDGEFHRRHWFMDFIERIDGVEIKGGLPVKFQTEQGAVEMSPPRVEVGAKLGRSKPLAVHHFQAMKPVADRHGLVAKQPIPSPTILHFRGGRAAIDKTAYPDMEGFFADLARVYREEIAALYAAGCRYILVDETNFAFLCDPKLRENVVKLGEDPDKLPATYVKLLNDSLRDVPDDMTVGMHICRGNHASAWVASGGYDPVAEAVFGSVDVDALFLEYDTDRAGSFAPLKYLGKDKVAVLGLVTSKKPQLETKETLKRRIDEAAKFVPLERLALSPQCGFASTIEGNQLTHDDQRRKLELVVSVARDVWGTA